MKVGEFDPQNTDMASVFSGIVSDLTIVKDEQICLLANVWIEFNRLID